MNLWRENPDAAVRVKGQLACLYHAQVAIEKHPCPYCGGKAQVALVDGKISVLSCCDAYEPEIQDLIIFNR